MPFTPGQRIVCVNVTRSQPPNTGWVGSQGSYLHFQELHPRWRFRPVADRPTSIEVFRSLLVPSEDKVTA